MEIVSRHHEAIYRRGIAYKHLQRVWPHYLKMQIKLTIRYLFFLNPDDWQNYFKNAN